MSENQGEMWDKRTDGEQARDEAMRQAEAAANEVWKSQAGQAILQVCQKNRTFTTDDVWKLVGPPREPRAMGPMMSNAVRSEWCMPTDRTQKSTRVACHARPIRVYRSRIYLWNPTNR